MLLVDNLTDHLVTRRLAGFYTPLHKIKAHTNIRRNDPADEAVKTAVRNFNTLPPAQTLRVVIEEIAPRPTHCVMYTPMPPRPDPTLATDTNRAFLRRKWWTIAETERM
jgi:hypothetical protein